MTVLHYTGHIIAPPSGVGRFPADQETRVRTGIGAFLEKNTISAAYGSLAAGADILIVEAVIATGAEAHIKLPFAEQSFLATSVTPADAGWPQRFAAVKRRAASFEIMSPIPYDGNAARYADCAAAAMRAALARAAGTGEGAQQIAIWDGEETDGIAGTYADIRKWRMLGGHTFIIKSKID